MSDIVKRLRGIRICENFPLVEQAADEIERLRKLIDGAAETGEIYERRLSECEAENDALRQENERLVAANKARAEYLTTRRAGNDVDSYVSLAEAEIAALRSTIDDLTAGEIHTCHDHCQRTACILRRENTALRSRLAEAERNEGTLLGMIRHQRDVLRECLPYLNESMAGRRPGRSADDIRAAVKALTTDSATHRENERE